MKYTSIFFSVLIFLLIVLSPACQKEIELPIAQLQKELIDTLNEKNRQLLDSFIQVQYTLQFPEEVDPPLETAAPQVFEEDSIICTKTSYYWAPGYSEIHADGTEKLPGMLYNFTSILDGGDGLIIAARNPVKLSIDLVHLPGDLTSVVENPTTSGIREGIQRILLTSGDGPTPAYQFFDRQVVHSVDQLKVGLKGAGGTFFAKASSSFDFGNTEINSRIIYRFYQVYYRINPDIPNRPSGWFQAENDYEELIKNLGNYSPVYVSQVTYGREVIFLAESTKSVTELTAALNASFNGFIASGKVSVSSEYRDVINQSNIKAYVVGGNAQQGVEILTKGVEGLENYLVKGATFSPNESPGVALSYTLRFLKDNTIARIVESASYDVRSCENVPTSTYLYKSNPVDGYFFCPEKSQGDEEFGGNGPEVSGSVELYALNDREIWARVRFLFRERSHSGGYIDSQAKIDEDIHIFTLPPDKEFVQFLSDTYSETYHFDSDHEVQLTPVRGGDLVREFEINGNTEGNDLDCEEYTYWHSYLRFYLNDIAVKVRDL